MTLEELKKEQSNIVKEIAEIGKEIIDYSKNIEFKTNIEHKKKFVEKKNNNGVFLLRRGQLISIKEEPQEDDELVIQYSNHAFIVCKHDTNMTRIFSTIEEENKAYDKFCKPENRPGSWTGFDYLRNNETYSFFDWDSEKSTKRILEAGMLPDIKLNEGETIPTVNQLYLIILYKEIIKEIMPKIGGESFIKNTYNHCAYYLSSTMSDERGPWQTLLEAQTIYCSPGFGSDEIDGIRYYCVRPIIELCSINVSC